MKVLRLFIFFLIFILFLIAGIYLGSYWENPKTTPPQLIDTPRHPIFIETPNQRNLLLIGSDDFSYPTPKLEAIWLLIYYRDTPQVDIFPIFPFPDTSNPSRNQVIADSFSITTDGHLSQDFQNQLLQLDLVNHHYLVLDQYALIAITNLLGIPDPHQNGLLVSWETDSQRAIDNQSWLLKEACNNFQSGIYQIDNIKEYINHLIPHVITDLSQEQILADYQILRIHGEYLQCSFPSMTQ